MGSFHPLGCCGLRVTGVECRILTNLVFWSRGRILESGKKVGKNCRLRASRSFPAFSLFWTLIICWDHWWLIEVIGANHVEKDKNQPPTKTRTNQNRNLTTNQCDSLCQPTTDQAAFMLVLEDVYPRWRKTTILEPGTAWTKRCAKEDGRGVQGSQAQGICGESR